MKSKLAYDLINTLTGHKVRTLTMTQSEKDDRNWRLQQDGSTRRWVISVTDYQPRLQRA